MPDTFTTQNEAGKMNQNLLKVIKMKYGVHKQSDVAKASGLTESTVSLIWSGKRGLTLDTLTHLSKGAGVDPWDVWKESEQ